MSELRTIWICLCGFNVLCSNYSTVLKNPPVAAWSRGLAFARLTETRTSDWAFFYIFLICYYLHHEGSKTIEHSTKDKWFVPNPTSIWTQAVYRLSGLWGPSAFHRISEFSGAHCFAVGLIHLAPSCDMPRYAQGSKTNKGLQPKISGLGNIMQYLTIHPHFVLDDFPSKHVVNRC